MWDYIKQIHFAARVGFECGASTCQPISLGCKDDAVVRALASHQCGPGSIPRLGVICELSLLVLYSALRGFSSPQKPTFDLIVSIVNFSLDCPQLVLQALERLDT